MLEPVRPVGGGIITSYVVHKTKTHALLLVDRVAYIGIKEISLADLKTKYVKRTFSEKKLRLCLQGLAKYAVHAGMSPEAAEYLPKITPMSKEEIAMATMKGIETINGHKEAAAAEEAKDVAAGKAPRKLAGAALASALRKKEREEAAAAKALAAEVTEDIKKAEAEGTADELIKEVTKPGPKQSRKKDEKTVNLAVVHNKLKPNGEYKSASAMFKGLIIEDSKLPAAKRRTDQEIFKEVQAKFDLSDDKLGYVGWNRGKLKREGLI